MLTISGHEDSQLIIIRHIFWNICHSGSERMIRMPKSSIKGSLNNSEDRLHVDKMPKITIRSLILSCVAIIPILVLLHAPSIVLANLNCMAGIATILGEIREKHLFEQFSSRTTRRGLENYDFSSTVPVSSRTGPVEVGYKCDIIVHPNIEPRLQHHGTELHPVYCMNRALPVKPLIVANS
jgi:hypothetical protein